VTRRGERSGPAPAAGGGRDRESKAPAPMRAGSVGVMGGTFDPIHVGHLATAEEARQALGLERVLFMPAGVPPHKPDQFITKADHRVAMVDLAIRDNPAFELSRLEVDRTGPSFTVDTVELLVARARKAGKEPDVTVILSTESFRGLPTWSEPERLLRQCRLAIVPRDGFPTPGRAWVEEHFPGFEERVSFLDSPRLKLSATEIRERVAAGRSIRYLVPDAVIRYIEDHALYRDELWRKN
jgi:nicotinate-nucleotide adenylyltransferase